MLLLQPRQNADQLGNVCVKLAALPLSLLVTLQAELLFQVGALKKLPLEGFPCVVQRVLDTSYLVNHRHDRNVILLIIIIIIIRIFALACFRCLDRCGVHSGNTLLFSVFPPTFPTLSAAATWCYSHKRSWLCSLAQLAPWRWRRGLIAAHCLIRLLTLSLLLLLVLAHLGR
jgi:hypothetical protein